MNLFYFQHLALVVQVVLLASVLHLQAAAGDTTLSPPASSVLTEASTEITTPIPSIKPPSTTPEPKKDVIDCPESCTCSVASTRPAGIRIDCSESNLKSIPNLSKYSNVTDINLSNNLIEVLEVGSLPTSVLLNLDLSNNRLRKVVTSKRSQLNQLKELNMSGNSLSDLFATFGMLKLASLNSLDLSKNPIEKLTPTTFDNCKRLSLLRLSHLTSLETIHELSFSSLVDLHALKLSSGSLANIQDLSDKLFINNQKLQILNLSNNSLVEVPGAIRALSGLKMLFLDQNLMTSLRQSDFINLYNLNTITLTECPRLTNIDDSTFSGMSMLRFLVITYNPRLKYISPEAFKSAPNVTISLAKFDLRGNNLTTMSDLRLFSSLNVTWVDLSKNPFNCDCNIKWLTELSQLSSPVHCGAPETFKDLEVGAFFATKNCETVLESNYQTLIVAGFLLFLTGLLVAVFVQRSEACRRLLWKDQYGTIYYTKASFQPETA